jgi:hypothetical protein
MHAVRAVVLVAVAVLLDDQLRVEDDEQREHQQAAVELQVEEHRAAEEEIDEAAPEHQRQRAAQEATQIEIRATLRNERRQREAAKHERRAEERRHHDARVNVRHLLDQRTERRALQKAEAEQRQEAARQVLVVRRAKRVEVHQRYTMTRRETKQTRRGKRQRNETSECRNADASKTENKHRTCEKTDLSHQAADVPNHMRPRANRRHNDGQHQRCVDLRVWSIRTSEIFYHIRAKVETRTRKKNWIVKTNDAESLQVN